MIYIIVSLIILAIVIPVTWQIQYEYGARDMRIACTEEMEGLLQLSRDFSGDLAAADQRAEEALARIETAERMSDGLPSHGIIKALAQDLRSTLSIETVK